MTRNRMFAINHCIGLAASEEPSSEKTLTVLALQYGKSIKITKSEIKEVLGKTLRELCLGEHA